MMSSLSSLSLFNIVVLISGNGSNLQAILDGIENGTIQGGRVVAVVSNRKDAYVLVRAKERGIQTLYFPLKPFLDEGRTRKEYDTSLAQKIVSDFQPSLIVLAGWMHILSARFLNLLIDPKSGRNIPIINLHPALPNTFPGVHAIERAYEAFKKNEIQFTGCMVHLVIPEIDAGKTIVVSEVPIFPHDTLDDLEKRMHETEHKTIVNAVNIIINELKENQ